MIGCDLLGFHNDNSWRMNAYRVVSGYGALPGKSNFYTSIGQLFSVAETVVALHKVGFSISDYTDGNALNKAVCIIQSYTGIVN